jgi:hypothetical protein
MIKLTNYTKEIVLNDRGKQILEAQFKNINLEDIRAANESGVILEGIHWNVISIEDYDSGNCKITMQRDLPPRDVMRDQKIDEILK